MKIAILMLCHKNPQQINMFLDAMKHPAIEFFIHVDKKADIVEEIEHREDIHFLPEADRASVNWGGGARHRLRSISSVMHRNMKNMISSGCVLDRIFRLRPRIE